MKKFLYLLTLSFIFIYGCDKGESDPSLTDTNDQKIEESSRSVILYSISNNKAITKSINIAGDKLRTSKTSSDSNAKSSNKSSVTAHFTGRLGQYDFRAFEKNGKVHGQGKIVGDNVYFPNILSDFHFSLDCLIVEGNEAVYGGRITHVKENGNGGEVIREGWYFYHKVIDNGDAANSPPDQYSDTMIFGPTPYCDFVSIDYVILPNEILPDGIRWDEVMGPTFLGLVDVQNPGDQIVIK